MNYRTMKNKVSDFEAGFRAGMMVSGFTKKDMDDVFYKTMEIPNLMRKLLLKYEDFTYVEKAIENMESYITDFKIEIIKKEDGTLVWKGISEK